MAHLSPSVNGDRRPCVRGRPIHFMFGSTVGSSRSADRMALFPVSPNPRWRPSRHLENSNADISTADHPIHSVFGSTTEFWGSADRMALLFQ